MIRRFTSLLRQIVGRIKKMSIVILMGLLGILLPIGAAFFLLAYQTVDSLLDSLSYLIVGIIFWGIGIFVWAKLKKAYDYEENEKNKRFRENLKELRGIREDIKNSIGELVSVIKNDRERKGKEGNDD